MPLWCPSSDTPESKNSIPIPHHRIVRIPPGEAVVLNSAERAPYLLYIEVLRDDLDFDPSKRSNKEILRKMVNKEGRRKDGWPEPLSSLSNSTPRLDAAADNSLRTPFTSMIQTPPLGSLPTAASSTSTFSNTDEEVDLVEQLYGTDQSLRSNIEDSIVLPPTPKNRELDMVAWSRASLPLASEDCRSQVHPSQFHSNSPSVSRTASSAPAGPEISRALSLDEYSERMRTAAIMLAQLNTDQGREPLPVPQAVDSSSNPGNNNSRKLSFNSDCCRAI